MIVASASLLLLPVESATAADGAAASMLSMSVSLIIVLATIALAAFLFKRLQPGMVAGASKAVIKPVTEYSLSPREKIVIVEIGESWLVLGVTSASVNLLVQQPKGDLPLPTSHPPAQAFADVLGRLLKKKSVD